MIYAEIDDNNICYAISDMGSVTVEKDTLIPISSFDEDVLGKRYNNGVWEDVPQPEPEPTDEEILQAEMLLNQQEILINQQSQDEVLAEILLGQQTM